MAVVAHGDIGSGIYTPGATSITIPLIANLPRSDPTLGATIIVISVVAYLNNTVHVTGISDDGATDPFYADEIFSDGANHYTQGPGWNNGSGSRTSWFSWWGLILNPLTTANSITIALDAIPDGIVSVMAHAFTGVNCNTAGANWPGAGTDASWMFTGTTPNQPCGLAASDAGTNADINLQWFYFGPGSGPGTPEIDSPIVTYPDWEWATGDLAFYNIIVDGDISDARGAWTWGSPDIETINEYDAIPLDSGYLYQVYGEQPVTAPLVGTDLGGALAADPEMEGNTATRGYGAIVLAGPGPTYPGLAGSFPVFNSHIRLSE